MLLVCNSSHFAASRRQPIAIQSLPHRPPFFNLNLRFSPNLRLSRYSLKCTALELKPPKSDELDIQIFQPYNYEDPPTWTPWNWNWIFLKKCAIGLVMMVVLLRSDPICAWAASGGRMGGGAFPSSPFSLSCSSSTSWDFPSLPPRPLSPMSLSPMSSYPCPLSSSSSSSLPPLESSSSMDGSRPEDINSSLTGSSLTGSRPDKIGIFIRLVSIGSIVILAGVGCGIVWEKIAYQIALADWEKTTVLTLQVGLLGSAKSLQRDLNRIAKTARTSTTKGLSHMLKKTTLALMRHQDYCISAYSCAHFKRNIKEGEMQFNRLSFEERAKFNEETLVNVNNTVTHRHTSLRADGLNNEYIVVTILVAIQGNHFLSTIKGSEDLKNALQELKYIPISHIRAVEVLWTPQAKNDTLSKNELIEDYPHLVSLLVAEGRVAGKGGRPHRRSEERDLWRGLLPRSGSRRGRVRGQRRSRT